MAATGVAMIAVAACGAASTGGSASPSASLAPCAGTGGLTGSLSDHGGAPISGSTATVDVGDFFFMPTCLTGVGAGTVTLTLSNRGAALHNISVPSQGIDVDIPPGQTVTVKVTVGSAPVRYLCKYHQSAGMQAVLVPSSG